MEGIAEAGCAAARENDSRGLLHAVGRYAEQLELLGLAIGADIVTREHRAIGEIARGFGLVYKVSGAGGGDLGLGIGEDPEALAAFERAAAERGYLAVNLHLASRGLVVEERTE
jgi:phosphomevalonate kinase